MPYYYFIVLFLLFGSCGRNTPAKTAEKPTLQAPALQKETKYVDSRLTSPEKNRLYSFHDELTIAFTSPGELTADSAAYFLDGKKIGTTGRGIGTYTYRLPETKTGNNLVKVTVWYPEGKQSIVSTYIRVKPDKAPKTYNWKVVNTFSHDPKAYTQGLVYQDGFMYEGTGQYGESTLRKIDIATGKILSILGIDSQLFGEGITIYKDKIYQITWRSRKGFIYDLNTFSLQSTFTYNTEGWGITTVGDKLIMSDGSNKLYHIAPSTFNIIKEVEVYDHRGAVARLNELEYIDGLVWANVWMTDRIVAIDPETGAVVGEMDMKDLLPARDKARLDDTDEVLNGIAYNPKKKTFYLTGKKWPKLFEVAIQP